MDTSCVHSPFSFLTGDNHYPEFGVYLFSGCGIFCIPMRNMLYVFILNFIINVHIVCIFLDLTFYA